MFRSLMGIGTPRSGGRAAGSAPRYGLFRGPGLLLGKLRSYRVKRSDLRVQLVGTAQIMVSDLDGRKLAVADGRGQGGHRKLVNLRHVTKW